MTARSVIEERDVWGMGLAIQAAMHAQKCGLRPFGSVIGDPVTKRVLSMATGTETRINPIRHSECIAIRQACQEVGGTLQGYTLWQTFEPCHMCCGAITHSKLSRVVVGSWRSDFPQLFRPYQVLMRDVLADTTTPPIVVVAKGEVRQRCLALFQAELDQLEGEEDKWKSTLYKS